MKRLIALATLLCLVVSGGALAAAKARSTSGVVYASANHDEGGLLYVSGDFKDKVLGRGAIVYVVKATGRDEPGSVDITAKRVTIYTPKGSLSGTGKAVQTAAPDGTATVTDGSFDLAKGTQAMRGHRLKGTFDGTFKDGIYTFRYKAKYR